MNRVPKKDNCPKKNEGERLNGRTRFYMFLHFTFIILHYPCNFFHFCQTYSCTQCMINKNEGQAKRISQTLRTGS